MEGIFEEKLQLLISFDCPCEHYELRIARTVRRSPLSPCWVLLGVPSPVNSVVRIEPEGRKPCAGRELQDYS